MTWTNAPYHERQKAKPDTFSTPFSVFSVLNNGLNQPDYIKVLRFDDNFSTSQANQFVSQYSIIHDQQDTSNGFSSPHKGEVLCSC